MKTLSSIIKNLFKPKTNDDDLLRWAKIEYGKNWRDAYCQMKAKPGTVPVIRGIVQ